MKIIFFGTPKYTLPILEMLHKTFKESHVSPIAAVVTQPPRPTGRKQEITYTEIDHWAHKRKIPKLYNPKEILTKNISADMGILAAYGSLIPQSVIDHFPYGILNVHPSILPNFRGASPVQATLATNSPGGATIIKLDKELDHGPIVTRFSEDVFENDTTESFRQRIFERSADVLKTLIPAYTKGKVTIKSQNHKEATFTTLIKKEHGFIDWKYIKLALRGEGSDDEFKIPFIKSESNDGKVKTLTYSPETIYDYIRALHPWPEVWTLLPDTDNILQTHTLGKRLKIISAHLEDGTLVLDRVQLEGKEETIGKNILTIT